MDPSASCTSNLHLPIRNRPERSLRRHPYLVNHRRLSAPMPSSKHKCTSVSVQSPVSTARSRESVTAFGGRQTCSHLCCDNSSRHLDKLYSSNFVSWTPVFRSQTLNGPSVIRLIEVDLRDQILFGKRFKKYEEIYLASGVQLQIPHSSRDLSFQNFANVAKFWSKR